MLVEAFFVRRPDENAEEFYRFLLERNGRMYGVHFAIDAKGDVYLIGRLPLIAVTPDEIGRLLGCVVAYADDSYAAANNSVWLTASDASGNGAAGQRHEGSQPEGRNGAINGAAAAEAERPAIATQAAAMPQTRAEHRVIDLTTSEPSMSARGRHRRSGRSVERSTHANPGIAAARRKRMEREESLHRLG